MDGDRGSAATIEKYAIPFPIERDGTANPPPTGAAQAKAIFMMALPGVTPKELPGMANTLKSMLPPEKYAVIADVVAHCATLSDDACTAYAKSQGLTIGGPVETPDPAGDAQVSLPATFVLDANGVVVKRLVGYDVSHDDLAAELDKLLGAPAAANP
jgi:hypothetical protein